MVSAPYARCASALFAFEPFSSVELIAQSSLHAFAYVKHSPAAAALAVSAVPAAANTSSYYPCRHSGHQL